MTQRALEDMTTALIPEARSQVHSSQWDVEHTFGIRLPRLVSRNGAIPATSDLWEELSYHLFRQALLLHPVDGDWARCRASLAAAAAAKHIEALRDSVRLDTWSAFRPVVIGAIGGSGFVWKAVQDDWWRPRPDPDPDGFTEPLAGGFLAMAARETTRAHTLFGQALEGVRGTGPRTAEMFGGLAELGRAICRQDATAVNNRAADRAAMWAKFVADDSEFDARIDTIDFYGLGFLAVARDWKLDITDNPAMPPGLISPFGAAESAWAAFLASGEMRSYTDRT